MDAARPAFVQDNALAEALQSTVADLMGGGAAHNEKKKEKFSKKLSKKEILAGLEHHNLSQLAYNKGTLRDALRQAGFDTRAYDADGRRDQKQIVEFPFIQKEFTAEEYSTYVVGSDYQYLKLLLFRIGDGSRAKGVGMEIRNAARGALFGLTLLDREVRTRYISIRRLLYDKMEEADLTAAQKAKVPANATSLLGDKIRTQVRMVLRGDITPEGMEEDSDDEADGGDAFTTGSLRVGHERVGILSLHLVSASLSKPRLLYQAANIIDKCLAEVQGLCAG